VEKINLLITGGCSFTQVPNTYKNWPIFLRDRLGVSAFFDGAGSAGNDLISRRVMHRVDQSLNVKKIPAEKLLVGVMWSGVNRHSFYLSEEPLKYTKFNDAKTDEQLYAHGNPNSIIDGTKRNVYMVSPHWDDELSNIYYKKFNDDVGALMNTLEHILRLQWYLKFHKIKYFFTSYNMDSFDAKRYQNYRDHVDLKYLYDQVDRDYFLPIENMGVWNRNKSGLNFHVPNDDHPTSEMSEAFTDRVIVPYLKKKGWV